MIFSFKYKCTRAKTPTIKRASRHFHRSNNTSVHVPFSFITNSRSQIVSPVREAQLRAVVPSGAQLPCYAYNLLRTSVHESIHFSPQNTRVISSTSQCSPHPGRMRIVRSASARHDSALTAIRSKAWACAAGASLARQRPSRRSLLPPLCPRVIFHCRRFARQYARPHSESSRTSYACASKYNIL
jgi:uncharacterized protein (DUF2342 family)